MASEEAKKTNLSAGEALALLLDQVDYTAGAGAPTEMVGALLPRDVIDKCRGALEREKLKPYTPAEVEEQLLSAFAGIAKFWSTTSIDNDTILSRCNGVVFSILAMLDGSSPLPAFNLVVQTDPADREFALQEGVRWFEHGTVLSSNLHEVWGNYEKKE